MLLANHRGLALSSSMLRRQLAALPCDLYEVRLIHSQSRKPYPGARRWTESQILKPATVGFLRIRNREGYDVYFRPYADQENAGYILLDLDCPTPGVLDRLRAQGHAPSVVVETSRGRWQAWIRVSREPLASALATRISRHLARLYAADPASADWRHVGRLAGFTNRKPQRRRPDGLAPWVKLIHAHDCVAGGGAALIQLALAQLPSGDAPRHIPLRPRAWVSDAPLDGPAHRTVYQDCLQRLHILERYPSPDWSIADKWVARELLEMGMPVAAVAAALRHGSPGFPRRHGDPEDYLRRTVDCAARQTRTSAFSRARIHPSPSHH